LTDADRERLTAEVDRWRAEWKLLEDQPVAIRFAGLDD
jgi:hypothetical protein